MAQPFDQPPIHDRPQRRADQGDELGQFRQVDVVAVLLLEGPPVEVVQTAGMGLGVPVVHRRQHPGPMLGVGKRQLEDVQDEQPLAQHGPVVAEDRGDLEQQLYLEAHQQREVGRRRQEAPGPGDPALGRGGLAPDVNRLLGPRLALGQRQVRLGIGGDEVGPGQHRPRHPRDRGGYGGVDFLGDEAVDPLLRGAGEAVQRAGRLGEVDAPG